MANQPENTQQSIADQIVKLVADYKNLQSKYTDLEAELLDVKSELEDAKRVGAEYKNNYDRLKLAKAFGLSEESKKQAHNRINKLVREIDSCIKILNKECL